MTTPTPAPVSLDSTTLTAAAYDDRREKLQLDFRDGTRYVYSGVTANLYRDLLCATSKGSFFNRYIRGHFLHAKLSPQN
jgi:KTSC domain